MLKITGLILLWILRIIGSILGVIVFLLLLILFVPFRYTTEGKFDNNIDVKVKFSWLFHFINGYYIRNDSENKTVVKLFFFKINKSKKDSDKTKNKTKDKDETKKVKVLAENQPKEVKKIKEEKIEKVEEEIEKQVVSKNVNKKETKLNKENDNKTGKNKENKKNKKNKKKQNSKQKKDENPTITKIKSMWNFLQLPENEGTLKFITKYLVKIIKWILPKKVEINMEIGLEDPSITGYIAAVTSIVYVVTKKNVVVVPNFNEEVMKGYFKIRGRLYLYQLVYYIIRVILDKRVRRLIKEVRG